MTAWGAHSIRGVDACFVYFAEGLIQTLEVACAGDPVDSAWRLALCCCSCGIFHTSVVERMGPAMIRSIGKLKAASFRKDEHCNAPCRNPSHKALSSSTFDGYVTLPERWVSGGEEQTEGCFGGSYSRMCEASIQQKRMQIHKHVGTQRYTRAVRNDHACILFHYINKQTYTDDNIL